ncbi:FixH family protein [Salinibius halmophilus]|uniref:FixH family protein n=1 Tax=Salinibius halmophilus TaxID=1853216 RepID=UPI000E6640E4|nr:FixH family protein [Salinibius halmophilus]
MTENKPTPGYKSPYMWMVLIPVMASVVAGTTFLIASIVSWDGVVVDNYYKDGRSYEMRQDEDYAARQMGLSALMLQQGDNLLVQVNGEINSLPKELKLYVIHPTKSDFDQRIDFTLQEGNRYLANTEITAFEGSRILQLQPFEAEQMWRVHGNLERWPSSIPVNLTPAIWQ